MKITLFLSPVLFCGYTCETSRAASPNVQEFVASLPDSIHPDGPSIQQRFEPPAGFTRLAVADNSFGAYLRKLPLKPVDSKVLYYNGQEKENAGIYAAVVNLPIGTKNLHQCADAVIRLRAEYLRETRQFDQIHFNLTNGFRVDYSRWRQGDRVKVTGNQTSWERKATYSDTDRTFWQYLEVVFSYAGTFSLSRELKPVKTTEMQIGDVFIQGGSPGHAVIVVDMAAGKNGRTVFLLAQSYMPAQELQILKNPQDRSGSAWYSGPVAADLETPQWDFKAGDLKRF